MSIYFIGIMIITIFLWRWMALRPNNYSRLSHEMNIKRQLDRIRLIQEPKIVFIGGSGCGFGLCSPIIHERYNMPVVNTGTHAGIGLRLMLMLYKPYIHRNDIVIVIPEYAHYMGDFYLGDATVLRIFSSSCQEGYRLLDFKQQLHLFKYAPIAYKDARSVKNLKVFEQNNPYSADALNDFGDVEMYDHRAHKEIKGGRDDMDKEIQYGAIQLLCEFYQYCEDQGATMIIFPPAFRDKTFEQNVTQINLIWETLSNYNLPIVSSPDDYKLPDSLYYDTDYHLTYEGVILRTNKVISDLDSLGIIQ